MIPIVKISKKSLPDNCSRYARVQWLRSFFDIFTLAATAAVPTLTRLESEPCLTLFHKQSEPITSAMIIPGTAYFKFRKSLIGPSTRLKTNGHEVLNILMKENIYTKHYNKRMAECLATVQKRQLK